MEGFDLNLLSQFGVAGLMFGGFMFLLKWVLKLKERILIDAKEERVASLSIIKDFQSSIDTALNALKKEQEQGAETIILTRDQHQKILEVAAETCRNVTEFRKEFAESAANRRREHEKIIALADTIISNNGLHEKRVEVVVSEILNEGKLRQREHEKMIEILDEQQKTLIKLNGNSH